MNCHEELPKTPHLELPEAPTDQLGPVKAWGEPVNLATYLPEPADRNPMFLESRVYQGSSGRVYPLPFYDRIAVKPVMRLWNAVHLENEYLRLMILPEIGGRIHIGQDKTNGYDFFYRQNVIKPALVGLAGPWISGGVEFNWPQHHRPATFMPVQTEIERHVDGSVTVWCSDHDPLQRMKGMHGVCLHPGTAVVEVKFRLYNRTELTQTFLWWANVATRVHEHYQSFFPPDVRFVADHAKRAITSFPRSDRSYYGVDYPRRLREGVPPEEQPRHFHPDGSYPPDDLSWYANIPVPTSYMVTSTEEDFFGGYDHRAGAGVLHYADHHVVPGKKQWTWGNHEFGYAWDHSLTDCDGPYIELMAGAYTDNQPDFSFLQPFETKSFSQYWYPLQKIGPPQAASLDYALSVYLRTGKATIGVHATSDRGEVAITLLVCGLVVQTWTGQPSPGVPMLREASMAHAATASDIEVRLERAGEMLLRYAPCEIEIAPAPQVASEPPAPQDVPSNDMLYLTGLHLTQYRHATRRPEPYWHEALRRDEGDARANIAMARFRLNRGELALAEKHLLTAIARLTMLNPNPADGEAYYLLGLVLRFRGDLQGSYNALAKAAWNESWKCAAHYGMAQIDGTRGRWEEVLRNLEISLAHNTENLNARNLYVIALRKLGREDQQAEFLRGTRALDPLDQWSRYLAEGSTPENNQALLELVRDYLAFGEDAIALDLLWLADTSVTDGNVPLILYTLAWLLRRLGHVAESRVMQEEARTFSSDYCFPFGLQTMQVLEDALAACPSDARAAYYLGNLYYDRQRYEEAINMWLRAAPAEQGMATVHRNLGIALFNIRGDVEGALQAFDRAFEIDPVDGRILYERDQLWKRTGVPPLNRLHELMQHKHLVEMHDNLCVELVTLLNQIGRSSEALSLLLSRKFQPWEGGEGLALGQYTRSLILLARRAIDSGEPTQAISLLKQALEPPQSLGEGRHLLANMSDIEYWLGTAYAIAGNREDATYWLVRASRSTGDFQEMSVRTVSDMTYWKGAALRALGHVEASNDVFNSIRVHADQLEQQEPRIDYFATSLPAMLLFRDDLKHRQRVLVSLLRAQSTLGLSGVEEARPLFGEVLTLDVNQPAAADFLQCSAENDRAAIAGH